LKKLKSKDVNFVTRKITSGVAQIASGNRKRIRLGNLDAERDWSHAKDFMKGVYMMMQYSMSGDYVLASGEKHSVREFAEVAFKEIGVELLYARYPIPRRKCKFKLTSHRWEGEGLREVGKDRYSGSVLIEVDESLYRALDVPSLQGSAKKAMDVLDWRPETSFQELVNEMVHADLKLVEKGYIIKSTL
jgi:GDPmannose 4,6-dehydratase